MLLNPNSLSLQLIHKAKVLIETTLLLKVAAEDTRIINYSLSVNIHKLNYFLFMKLHTSQRILAFLLYLGL